MCAGVGKYEITLLTGQSAVWKRESCGVCVFVCSRVEARNICRRRTDGCPGSRVNRVFRLLDMRAGARGQSSREVEAENRRYLEREVERRV